MERWSRAELERGKQLREECGDQAVGHRHPPLGHTQITSLQSLGVWIIESYNHRMAWVAKDHNAHPVPTPCYVQGRQPADQAAQSHIQPGLECLQGWGIHSLLGQPVKCVTTLWVKNFFLMSNLNIPCPSLKLFPLVLSLSTLTAIPPPVYMLTSSTGRPQ